MLIEASSRTRDEQTQPKEVGYGPSSLDISVAGLDWILKMPCPQPQISLKLPVLHFNT